MKHVGGRTFFYKMLHHPIQPMAKHLHDHVILNLLTSSYPNINPIGNYVGSVVEMHSNSHPNNTVAALRAAVVYEISNFPITILIIACSQFQQRLQAVIAASDGWVNGVIHCVRSHRYRSLTYKNCAICIACSCLKADDVFFSNTYRTLYKYIKEGCSFLCMQSGTIFHLLIKYLSL